MAGGPAWGQGKSLTLSMLAGYKEDVLRASLPEFEETTGIKGVVDVAPFGDLYKKQLPSITTGGEHYDVLFMDGAWVPPLSEFREFLLPLNERVKGLDLADFVPTTVAAGAFQGTQYALPVDPNVQILVYRKDLFEQKGLKPPTTWDELLAAAKALHDPTREKYGIAVTASSDIQTALYMLLAQWSYGAELVDATGRGGLNTPAGHKGGEVSHWPWWAPASRGFPRLRRRGSHLAGMIDGPADLALAEGEGPGERQAKPGGGR